MLTEGFLGEAKRRLELRAGRTPSKGEVRCALDLMRSLRNRIRRLRPGMWVKAATVVVKKNRRGLGGGYGERRGQTNVFINVHHI